MVELDGRLKGGFMKWVLKIIFNSCVLMINNYSSQQLTSRQPQNIRTSSKILPHNLQKSQILQQVKFGKSTYSQIVQSPQGLQQSGTFSHRVKPEEHIRKESKMQKKGKDETIMQDPNIMTPKKISLNGSYIKDHQRFSIKEKPEKLRTSFYNQEKRNEPSQMTPSQPFSKQIPTQREYHTFPKPSDILQRSMITRPSHPVKDFTIIQNQENYFEYILEYSYRSKKGISKMDPDKVNQDSFVTAPNLNNQSWSHYFGVCDGHGQNGHLVSQYAKKNLPLELAKIRNVQENPKQKFMNAFKTISDKLPKDLNVDLGMSGSTSVGVYLSHNKLYCLNLGDSKAVLGSKDKQNKWMSTALSIDHKPQNPSEGNRIIRSNGRIDSYRDQNGKQAGPMRVWLKNQNTPGLAMTRCFGDQVAMKVGVISIPQIREFTLTEKDKIIIVASDGIWEFLTEQQVIDTVAPFYEQRNIEGACNVLLEKAVKLWKQESEGSIDDITFVLLFLDYNMDK